MNTESKQTTQEKGIAEAQNDTAHRRPDGQASPQGEGANGSAACEAGVRAFGAAPCSATGFSV